MKQKPIVVSFPGKYGPTEEQVLKYLFEHPDSYSATGSLAMVLDPNPEADLERSKQAFRDAQQAVETLIAAKLVTGRRRAGLDGVFYERLSLTKKGEAEAIVQKRNKKIVLDIPRPRLDTD